MKIITRAVFQMTPEGYDLLEEVSHDYEGLVARAKGGSAPAAPDPAISTNAEAAANRTNVTSPFGTSTWSRGDTDIIGYDSSGNPQYGSTWNQDIKLNPSEQTQYDTRNQIAEQLLGSASTRIPEFADNAFSFDSATPEVAKAQYTKNMALLEPEFAKADDRFEQKWANAGIPVGSEAYNDVMRQHEGDQNTARSSAAADAITYGNTLSQQERQQNYNELAAALGSQQLNLPNAGTTPGAPLDVSSAYQNQYNSRLANWNAGQAEQQGTTNALVSAGTMAAMAFF